MTVCVAAICDDSIVLGASDRMITAGDVEFEPPQPKVFALTSSVSVMVAGDTALQTEILYEVQAEVSTRVKADPNDWWRVQDVADLYLKHYVSIRSKRASIAVLAPLGLNHVDFIAKQQQLSPQLTQKLAAELINFEMPEVEAIVAGVDMTGPHIYVVDNRGTTVRDAAGFAAIGAGYWHANSQFMFAGHARSKPVPQTLLLTYAAKRRAEVAPGVGEGTDMFWIGPTLGQSFPIGEHVLDKLESVYMKIRKKAQADQEKAFKEVTKYVDELSKAATTKEQEKPATSGETGGTPSTDGQGETATG